MKLTHKRIEHPSCCKDKTIASVIHAWGHTLGFRFTDGTFLYVKAKEESFSGDGPELDFRADFEDISEATGLGVIDDDEAKRCQEEKDRRDESWDRAKYEQLKAKFDPDIKTS